MRIKMNTVIKGHSFEIEGDNIGEVLDVVQQADLILPEQATALPARDPGAKVGGSWQDMLAWLRGEERNHSKTWIAKNSGLINSLGLLSELKRLGLLEWHEIVYGTKSLRHKTMMAAFVDGKKPPRNTPEEDIGLVLTYIKDHPGNSAKGVEMFCGVVKTCAQKALSTLIARAEVEMREDPNDSSCYKVYAVE